MKIKFRSDDDLPLNKMLELPNIVILLDLLLMKATNITLKFTEKNVSINYKC